MGDVISEAAQMPNAAIRFAQGIDTVWTPEHLVQRGLDFTLRSARTLTLIVFS
jgi:hypothetical protein